MDEGSQPRGATAASDPDASASAASAPEQAPPDVRLVVVDLDGTLLDGDRAVPDGTVELIRDLRGRGIAFAPASGRQHATIAHHFAAVTEGLVIIAENGAYVTRDGVEVSAHVLDTDWVRGVVRRCRELALEGADLGVVVCGKRSAWVERTDDAFMSEVTPYYLRLSTTVDLTTVEDDVLKVAVYDFGNPEDATAPDLARFCAPQQVVVSGAHWVDVMGAGIDKGLAVRELQAALGITRAQTMAFGDYLNDLEMLEAADLSYAVANAHPTVRERANHLAPANTEHGVLTTLRAVLGL